MVNEVFSFGVTVNAKNSSIGGQDFLAGGEQVWRGSLKSRENHRFTPDEAAKFPAKETVTMIYANTPDVNLGFQQKVDLWLTLAYASQLTDGYTALPP